MKENIVNQIFINLYKHSRKRNDSFNAWFWSLSMLSSIFLILGYIIYVVSKFYLNVIEFELIGFKYKILFAIYIIPPFIISYLLVDTKDKAESKYNVDNSIKYKFVIWFYIFQFLLAIIFVLINLNRP
jgi:hypothetical protein